MQEIASTLFALRLVKLVLEVCLLALVGQGIATVLIRATGQDPKENLFHRVLSTVSSPFTWLVRRITPPFIADRHVPLATFALLLVCYATVLFTIADTCMRHGLTVADCMERR
ncbi:hypothetical protein BURK1_01050 [Burkholderiales bacterium]|nr:hypothetical protein BURK1_01050 [Burkholderiales bacterium]